MDDMTTVEDRAGLLCAALGFLIVDSRARELRLLHRWLDSWSGIGPVVAGMARQRSTLSYGATRPGPARNDVPSSRMLVHPLSGTLDAGSGPGDSESGYRFS